jgi:hypothetical protein
LALQQNNRHVDEYILEFQNLHDKVPDMAQADALYQFQRGLRQEIAIELTKANKQNLQEAVELAARVGGLLQGANSSSSSSGRSTAHQMEMVSNGNTGLIKDLTEAVLNAIQAQQGMSGIGAKTQTHQGYLQENLKGGAGRGGQSQRKGPPRTRPPFAVSIPGVSPQVVEQRRAAGQCFRCGQSGHRSIECPNSISSSQPLN